MTRRSLLILGLAIIAAAAMATLAARRAHLIGAPPEDYTETTFRAGKAAFTSLKMVEFRSLADRAAFRRACDAGDIRPEQGMSRGSIDALLDQVAGLFYFRFGQGSPTEYRRWRDSTGAVARPMSEMIARADLKDTFRVMVGRDLAPGAGVEQAFADLWDATLDYGAGFNRPVGMGADEAGLTVLFGTWTKTNAERVSPEGRLSSDIWRGGISATMRSWWTPPVTAADVLAAHGTARYAEVGVVVQYADGSRRPLALSFVHDPDRYGWVLLFVNAYNFGRGTAISPMEY